MNVKYFWSNVKVLIKSNNTTQEWLANTCGVSYRTFQNWISRNISPDIISAYKIAQALNTSVEYLVTGYESNPYKQRLEELETKIKNLL